MSICTLNTGPIVCSVAQAYMCKACLCYIICGKDQCNEYTVVTNSLSCCPVQKDSKYNSDQSVSKRQLLHSLLPWRLHSTGPVSPNLGVMTHHWETFLSHEWPPNSTAAIVVLLASGGSVLRPGGVVLASGKIWVAHSPLSTHAR